MDNSDLPSHIQRDFDVILPFYRAVNHRVEKATNLSMKRLDELVDGWRIEYGHQQFETQMYLAAQSDEVAAAPNEMLQTNKTLMDRFIGMDTKGITTGPATRCIMAMVEHHDMLGISAIDMRRILNQAAKEIGTPAIKLLPELGPFMTGRTNDSIRQH